MAWKLRLRNDVEPIFPLRGFFCVDNRMGAFIGSISIGIATLIAFICVFLDVVSFSGNFDIEGGFPSQWRRSFWKGFVAVDVVMLVTHCVLMIMGFILFVGILKPGHYKLYRLYPLLRAFFITLILHTVVEFGVSIYIYSWYGLAGWRRPFLIFNNVFYIMRFLMSLCFTVATYSYSCEVYDELNAIEDPQQSVQGYDYRSVVQESVIPASSLQAQSEAITYKFAQA